MALFTLGFVWYSNTVLSQEAEDMQRRRAEEYSTELARRRAEAEFAGIRAKLKAKIKAERKAKIKAERKAKEESQKR